MCWCETKKIGARANGELVLHALSFGTFSPCPYFLQVSLYFNSAESAPFYPAGSGCCFWQLPQQLHKNFVNMTWKENLSLNEKERKFNRVQCRLVCWNCDRPFGWLLLYFSAGTSPAFLVPGCVSLVNTQEKGQDLEMTPCFGVRTDIPQKKCCKPHLYAAIILTKIKEVLV